MSPLSHKLRRLSEAYRVSMLGADLASKVRLARCFAMLGRTVTDPTEIDLLLRTSGRPFPCRMRRSDVFTLIELFHEGQYEHELQVPARPMIVDAGANIGVATLWLLDRYPDATVHAFEPESGNYRLLSANVSGHPTAFAHRAALGASDGEIELTLSEHGAMHTTSAHAAGARTERVPCRTLAEFMEEQGIATVDLLKLDVEGAEIDVLTGLGDRLRDVRAIVGEVHERIVDPEELYALLDAAGFRTRRVAFTDGASEGVHGFEAHRSAR